MALCLLHRRSSVARGLGHRIRLVGELIVSAGRRESVAGCPHDIQIPLRRRAERWRWYYRAKQLFGRRGAIVPRLWPRAQWLRGLRRHGARCPSQRHWTPTLNRGSAKASDPPLPEACYTMGCVLRLFVLLVRRGGLFGSCGVFPPIGRRYYCRGRCNFGGQLHHMDESYAAYVPDVVLHCVGCWAVSRCGCVYLLALPWVGKSQCYCRQR